MSFNSPMIERISLLTSDGARIDDIPAQMQSDKIIIAHGMTLIETGDVVLRLMRNGAQEMFKVIDPGFREAFQDTPARYEVTVEELKLPEEKNTEKLITYNITAPTVLNINNSTIGAVQTGRESVANVTHQVSVQQYQYSSGLKELLFEFMRKYKMREGYVIPEKPFRFVFYPSLNPKQQDEVLSALDAFVREGILDQRDGLYVLTARGYQQLY